MMLRSVFLYLVVGHVICAVAFLFVFLPWSSHNKQNVGTLPQDIHGLPLNVSEFYGARVKQVVLMVVDALRADFLLGSDASLNFPFVSALQADGKACSYLARAHVPTVTLPRIKAIVTGTVPGFQEIISNLASTKLNEDSVIHQAHQAGLGMIFYGDETWLKLFPGYFQRYEGTTSFFVSDFTEVDDNVTRHLDKEMEHKDWSLMILHYLGLDHIGHLSGPKSKLVPQKLREMDDVIRKIYTKSHRSNTAIIICGDHGMSDSGSHGGSSQAEVEVPITFIMEGCNKAPGIHQQISLASTLSTLLGLPIPANNLGPLLKGLLPMNSTHKLYSTYMNARTVAFQFLSTHGNQAESSIHFSNFRRAETLFMDFLISGKGSELAAEIFLNATEGMSDDLTATLISHDVYAMFVTAILLFQMLVLATLSLLVTDDPAELGYSLITVVPVLFTLPVHVFFCLNHESSLCFSSQSSAFATLGLNAVLAFLYAFNWHLLVKYNNRVRRCVEASQFTILGALLVFGSLFHGLSMFASSFVEEEHQTYYFATNSLIASLAWLARSHDQRCRLVLWLLVSRICRGWNANGDKWASEADAEDWFNVNHGAYITFAYLISLIGIYLWTCHWLRLKNNRRIPVAISLIATFAYRAAVRGVSIPHYPESRGTAEAAVAYCCIFALVLLSDSRSLFAAWIVLTCLLKRPHNVVLMLMQTLQYTLAKPLLVRMDPFPFSVAHCWIGMCWYFQQGNGNNLARVDLAAGYTGTTGFNPVIVAILLLCNTYSGPVSALLFALHSTHNRARVLSAYLWCRIVVMVVVLTAVICFREHLFIWTVFSPKLLYEVACSVFLSLCFIGLSLF